jgi:DNA-binding NarL/FixJ family response regulator
LANGGLTKKPSLLLADDHNIVLEGVIRVLASEFAIMGTAHDGYELLDQILRVQPDVVVCDLSMPGLNGIDVLRRIKAAKIRTKFIVLTIHAEAETATTACVEGASGYVLKHSAVSELPRAVRAALAGDVYVDPALAPEGTLNFVHSYGNFGKPSPGLTRRERDVLKLAAEGRTLKEIAGILRISESTAGFHKYNMMHKLSLKTTAQLTQYAIRHGLIDL